MASIEERRGERRNELFNSIPYSSWSKHWQRPTWTIFILHVRQLKNKFFIFSFANFFFFYFSPSTSHGRPKKKIAINFETYKASEGHSLKIDSSTYEISLVDIYWGRFLITGTEILIIFVESNAKKKLKKWRTLTTRIASTKSSVFLIKIDAIELLLVIDDFSNWKLDQTWNLNKTRNCLA